MIEIGSSLGADVPFFLFGGRALGVGRGDEIYPLARWRAPDRAGGFATRHCGSYGGCLRLAALQIDKACRRFYTIFFLRPLLEHAGKRHLERLRGSRFPAPFTPEKYQAESAPGRGRGSLAGG